MSTWMKILIAMLGAASGLAAVWTSQSHRQHSQFSADTATPTEGECCSKASSRAAAMLASMPQGGIAVTPQTVSQTPTPSTTVYQSNWPEKPWPDGMVWIPGGEFTMGGVADDPDAKPDEFPVHRVRVDGFWMDETEVTVAQFKKFIEATNYVTIAERKPDWEELKKQLPPGTPKPDDSLLVAGSMVFSPTDGPVPFDDWQRWWSWVPGADWKHPLGPQSSVIVDKEYDNHPVVHVAWDDAVAYCKWANKRLPTEAEWERACRGGEEKKRFIWGDDVPSETNIKANLWQGNFPYEKKPADGFLLTAPVRSFPPNRYGLYDIIGNVWEWCDDWYRADIYQSHADRGGVAVNPEGPRDPLDPEAPFTPKRVNRGGSFLCNSQYCASYRPSARMRTSPDTGQNHLGFRCVMSHEGWSKQIRSQSTGERPPAAPITQTP